MYQFKKSGKEVDHTIFKILLVKTMLCSKLHCQKSSKLKQISYKIGSGLDMASYKAVDLRQNPSLIIPVKTENLSFFFFITLGQELSDTKVYEP